MSSSSKNGGQLKTYFKLAKTIHLFSQKPEEKDKIDELLKRTQYERKKDLTNIRYNLRGENFVKKPVLWLQLAPLITFIQLWNKVHL